jgi:6-phosphofructokinase 1
MGILVGGGPAPGINGVIGAATIEAVNNGLEVVGIYDGFKWLARGDASHTSVLGIEDVIRARFRGGSVLNTSRENPTKEEAKMQNVVKALGALGIEYLVTVGGDDTAFSASKTSEYAGGSIRVAHVPKTIDNDLPLPGNMPTFGFRTAQHVGAQLVANLVEDARTTNRWYVVVAMGRSAGHLALGMGNVGGAALTLIPEEFSQAKVTLELVCEIIEAATHKGKALGRNHGVVVIAEGVGDLLKEELKDNPLVVVEHDEHGHFRLGEVPLAVILKRTLQQRAADQGQKVTLVDVTIGYELRCADPIPFDAEYCQQLGWGAVNYLVERGERRWTGEGAMISIQAGEVVPIPFSDILDPETGKTSVRRVNVNSDEYMCARSYMVRLERSDLEDSAQLKKISAAAGIPPSEFRKKYARAAEL